MSNLVIVESPAKAKTIERFLGKKYKVMASVGHVRDLPKSTMGVDMENDFEPKYINIRGKGPTIKALKVAAKKADKVYLATDPDREGEAIAWHLAFILGIDNEEKSRVVFREITKESVKSAIKDVRGIDTSLVDAQQARRILDRLVGYSISPLLWRKVKKGLSAGRVQSVATKLICDREKEIEAFVPEEYWDFEIETTTSAKKKLKLSYYGPDTAKTVIKSAEEAQRVEEKIKGADAVIESVEEKERKRSPLAPYTTSTLQQDAANRIGFATRKTMMIAQQLYEGVAIKKHGTLGLITYMRTDSTRVSETAKQQAEQLILEEYGKEYLGSGRKTNKKQKNAQDAHEAIRPTTVALTPAIVSPDLTKDQLKLYTIIWNRFVASLMSHAVYNSTVVTANAAGEIFKVTGSTLAFDGFMKVYSYQSAKDNILPKVSAGDILKIKKILKEQKFTLPPARYTEASLVRRMEENGIGRPSTYAPTISTILARYYVAKEKKSLVPTELGVIINEIVSTYFKDIVDVDFTANMEKRFDAVESGEQEWKQIIRDFYKSFEPLLEKADRELEKIDVTETTDLDCPKCSSKLLIRQSRYGRFYACSAYPECKYTKAILKEIGVDCPKCEKGQVVERKTKKLKLFYGCSEFPNCDFVTWNRPTGESCPVCKGTLVHMRGDKTACMDKECEYNMTGAKKTAKKNNK